MNLNDEWDEAFRMGIEAMRAACIAAVEAMAPVVVTAGTENWYEQNEIVSILRGVQP